MLYCDKVQYNLSQDAFQKGQSAFLPRNSDISFQYMSKNDEVGYSYSGHFNAEVHMCLGKTLLVSVSCGLVMNVVLVTLENNSRLLS